MLFVHLTFTYAMFTSAFPTLPKVLILSTNTESYSGISTLAEFKSFWRKLPSKLLI